jgi:hypothetical protein
MRLQSTEKTSTGEMDISLGKVGSQSATWAERTGNTRIDIFTA